MKYISKSECRRIEAKEVTIERVALAIMILVGVIIAYTHGIH